MPVSIDDLVTTVSEMSVTFNDVLTAINVQKSYIDNAASSAGGSVIAAANSASQAATSASAAASSASTASTVASGVADALTAANDAAQQALDTLAAIGDAVADSTGAASAAATSAGQAATSASAAAASASSISGSVSAAATSATNAATSASNAATSASAAATSATDAATVVSGVSTALNDAQTAADSALAALADIGDTLTAAEGFATAASGSASSASTSAGTATTKAGEASTSASAAAGSASSASTSAGTATTKAGEASTSATNAATSETNAAASASDAADSAAAAAASALEASAGQVSSDWNSVSGPSQILNKPTIPTSGADIGLGNVENKSSATIRGEITSGNVTAALAFTPMNAASYNNVENKSSATIRGEITSGNVTGALGFTPINPSVIGAASGLVPLDGSSKIASTYLPSYVDDVLEYANLAAFPGTGETGKIYIAIDTNVQYRWGGSAYAAIIASPGTTDAVTEGSTNLYFTTNRVLATVLAGLSLVTNAAITSADTVVTAFGKIQKQITDLLTAYTAHAGSGGSAHANATTSVAGFMSSTDKTKLDGVSGTNTGDQLTFKTISVSGQSDVVADGITDTLNLVAGTNVTLTTNAGTDSITINASSGSSITTTSVATSSFGETYTLPNATGLSAGSGKLVHNTGGYDLRIVNFTSGVCLGFIGPYSSGLFIVNNVSTADGVWDQVGTKKLGITASRVGIVAMASSGGFIKSITLDSNRQLLIGSGGFVYGIVYDSSTRTFGAETLLRNNSSVGGANSLQANLITTDKVLVVSCNSTTGLEAVCLTISGTTITPGTAATATLAGNFSYSNAMILLSNGTFIFSYFRATSISVVRGITVNTTTNVCTIGSEFALSGTATSANLFVVSSNVFLTFTTSPTTLYAKAFTVSSGTTLTGGTEASTTITSANFRVVAMSGGRWGAIYLNTNIYAALISVSGANCSMSQTSFTSSTGHPVGSGGDAVAVASNKILVATSASNIVQFNILTDTSGTLSVGTEVTKSFTAGGSPAYLFSSGTNAYFFVTRNTGDYALFEVGFSGSSPTVTVKAGVSFSGTTGPLVPVSVDVQSMKIDVRAMTTSNGIVKFSGSDRSASLEFTADCINVLPPITSSVVSSSSSVCTVGLGRNEVWTIDIQTTNWVIQKLEVAQ